MAVCSRYGRRIIVRAPDASGLLGSRLSGPRKNLLRYRISYRSALVPSLKAIVLGCVTAPLRRVRSMHHPREQRAEGKTPRHPTSSSPPCFWGRVARAKRFGGERTRIGQARHPTIL